MQQYRNTDWRVELVGGSHMLVIEGRRDDDDDDETVICEVNANQSEGSARSVAEFIAASANFVDDIKAEWLYPTYKGVNLRGAIDKLTDECSLPRIDGPLQALEAVLITVQRMRLELAAYADDDDDDDEYETDDGGLGDDHTERIDAIWCEFNNHFDEIDDEEGAYLNEVISPALDAIDEDTAKEIWALWFKNTENAEQRGVMLPGVIQRLGVKDFDDWIADDNG